MNQNANTSETSKADKQSTSWIAHLPIIVIVAALLLIGAYTVIFWSLPFDEKPEAWGQFGDYIGGLMNPLISALTLLVAINVWKLQKEELEKTSKELQAQKEIMERQLVLQTKQNNDLKRDLEQKQEEKYFIDTLQIYHRKLESMKKEIEDFNKNQYISGFIRHGFNAALYTPQGRHIPITRKDMLHNLKYFIALRSINLLSLLRVLKITIKQISQMNQKSKNIYLNLFVSQLSENEIIILSFYIWLANTKSEFIDNVLLEQNRVITDTEMLELANTHGLLRHLSNPHLRHAIEEVEGVDKNRIFSATPDEMQESAIESPKNP